MIKSLRGSFVVVVGPDGSGKTTLAHALTDRFGSRARYFHFLPRPIWRLSKRPGIPGELVDKHTEAGNRPLGWVRLARNVVKARLAYWLVIGPALRRGQTVVGDRYLYGYVVQPIPLKFSGPEWVARMALRLIPKPDLVVVLDAPTAVIRSRKPELSSEAIDVERLAWTKVAARSVVLDSVDSPDALVDQVLAVLKLPTRRYPPGLGHVTVPEQRVYALPGTALYGPSRSRAVVLHRTARLVTALVGGRWLSQEDIAEFPLGGTGWTSLLAELTDRGIRVDCVASYRRTQSGRVGFSFLALADGEPSAFVRVNAVSIDREIDALGLVADRQPRTFKYPELLCAGSSGSDRFAAFTPVLTGFHRPDPDPPVVEIADEVQSCLVGLGKPEGTPEHWHPMHGDFTPWNLRREGTGLVLVDWENAGWGPPDADITLYWAAAQAVGLLAPRCIPGKEAAQYWLDNLPVEPTGRDSKLKKSMERCLRSVAEGP